jgi:hypothetical protein
VRVVLQQRRLLLLLLLALGITQDVQQLPQLLRTPPGGVFTPCLLLLLSLLLLGWRRLMAQLLLLVMGQHWHAATDGRRHVSSASRRITYRDHDWAAVALCWLLHVPASWAVPQLLLLAAYAMCHVWRQHPTMLLQPSSSRRHVALRHLVAACIATLLLVLLWLVVQAAAAASAAWYAG